MKLARLMALTVALLASSAVAMDTPVSAQRGWTPVIRVELQRTVELDDAGVGRPVRLAATPDGRKLFVVEAGRPDRATVVGFAEDRQGIVGLSSQLRNVGLGFDAASGGLVPVSSVGTTISVSRRSINVGRLGVTGAAAVAVDDASGEWYVADGRDNVLVLDASGGLVRTLDLEMTGIGRITAMAVAASADQTDDPGQLSLYVLDEQQAGSTTLLREVGTGAPLAASASSADVSASLVQTIDGTSLTPNSPDSSGIAWLSAKNRLVLADSEVNEYSYFQNTNLWHLTTAGAVTSTGNTLNWSNEPTGFAVDNSGNRSFTTDDNAKRITEVDMGPDGYPGTADDTVVRFFSTLGYGNSDPEDLAYDTTRGWLHIADGTNKEVFTINPGPNGIFDGGGDDIISQWDTAVDGVSDPEGIAYHAGNDTLTVVDYSTGDLAAAQYAATGGVVRQISLAATNALHPAGATWAPASNGPGLNLWVVDRGIDGSSPRDGKLFELSVPPIGVAVPDVDVPASMNVGSVTVGSSGSASVMVSNLGSAPLSVSSTSLSGPDAAAFAVSGGGAPFTVPAGGSQTVTVTFSPTQQRVYSASLVVTSNDPDEPSVSVALSGAGVATQSGSVTVGASYTGGSGGLRSVSTSSVVSVPSTGRVFVAYVSTKSFASVTGVSGLGGTWSPVASLCGGRSQTGASVFVTTSASSSSTVTASLGSAPSNAVIAVVEYSGVSLTSPIGAVIAANTKGVNGSCSGGVDSASYSVSLTPTSTTSLVSSVVSTRNRSHTPGIGFTERLEASAGSGSSSAGLAIEEKSPSVPGAMTVDGQLSGVVDWAVVAIELRAGGSAPPSVPDVDVPASVNAGSVTVGSSGSASVVVSNVGSAALSVSSTSLSGADAAAFAVSGGGAPFTVPAGGSQSVTVTFSPTAVRGYSASLVVASDDPDEPSVSVALSGTGLEAPPSVPDVDVPGSVNVGSVTVGSSVAASVVVSNVGSAALSVSSTSLSGADAAAFAVSGGGAPFTVPAGGSQSVTVTFSPSDARGYSASLVVASDDPDEPSVSVALSGTGVATPSGSVTVGASYTGGSTALTSVSTSSVVSVPATGRVFVAYVSTKSLTTVTGVSGLGGTWTPVASLCAGRSQTGASVFVTTSASSASTVTASLGSAPSNAVIAVVEYSGVSLTSPIGAVVAANTNGEKGSCSGGVDSASYSVALTPTSSASLVSSVVAIRNRSHTPGVGFTERLETSAGTSGSAAGLAIEEKAPSAADAFTVSGQMSGTIDWAVIAIELVAAS